MFEWGWPPPELVMNAALNVLPSVADAYAPPAEGTLLAGRFPPAAAW